MLAHEHFTECQRLDNVYRHITVAWATALVTNHEQNTAAAAVAAAPVPARAPSRKCGFIHEGGVRCECTDSLIRVRADSYDTMATLWRIKGIADVSSSRLRPSCWSGTNECSFGQRAVWTKPFAFAECMHRKLIAMLSWPVFGDSVVQQSSRRSLPTRKELLHLTRKTSARTRTISARRFSRSNFRDTHQ